MCTHLVSICVCALLLCAGLYKVEGGSLWLMIVFPTRRWARGCLLLGSCGTTYTSVASTLPVGAQGGVGRHGRCSGGIW